MKASRSIRAFTGMATIVILTLSGCSPSGIANHGKTQLAIETANRFDPTGTKTYFDSYVLKAVDRLYNKYRGLGYDMNSIYTHDLPFGPFGFIKATPSHKTMCVASQLEVIVTAMDLYAAETGDRSVYEFLPMQSWKGLSVKDIKGHIWVNSRFNSFGTADALAHFGMGETTLFEKLTPGSFINFNRKKGSGHAVTFIAFIDKDGKEYTTHNPSVIGFKYFSAQGKKDPDGGLDFRYAVFDGHACPDMPYKKDCGIMYSKDRRILDSGRMWAPTSWVHKTPDAQIESESGTPLPDTVFDAEHFDGETVEE